MSDQPHPLINRLPAIHLLYSTTAFPTPDPQTIADQLAAMENPIPSGELEVSWALQQAQRCLGQIRFGDHELQVAGLPVPLHKTIIDRTIHVSHWPPQIKAALRQHQAHLSLVYTGKNTDPVEKMISLYTIAQAFENENLLGVANEAAWTAHPIADFLTPEKIANYRSAIPFNLWVGNVKFFVDEHNYWLVTKGHHIFDVPDLAYFVEPGDDLTEIRHNFINIFYYIYEKDVVVAVGDTLTIGETGKTMRFSTPTELADFLIGPAGTLVIEKIGEDQSNL